MANYIQTSNKLAEIIQLSIICFESLVANIEDAAQQKDCQEKIWQTI